MDVEGTGLYKYFNCVVVMGGLNDFSNTGLLNEDFYIGLDVLESMTKDVDVFFVAIPEQSTETRSDRRMIRLTNGWLKTLRAVNFVIPNKPTILSFGKKLILPQKQI